MLRLGPVCQQNPTTTVQRTPGRPHAHALEQAPVITAALLNGIGVVAVVLLLGLGLATGRLYTRPQVNEMKRAHERELENISHDRDEWRTEGRIKDQHIGEITDHNTTLLREIAPTLSSFLGGLRTAADKARGDD